MSKNLLIIVLFVLVMALFVVLFGKGVNDKYYVIEEYTITEGQTLWSISSEYVDNNTDIREYIYKIKELNNLSTSEVYAGQTIKILKEI